MHLWNQHVRDTVVILEEGNLPHPRCPLCYMLVPWRSLDRLNQRTEQCTKGAEQKRRRLAVKEERVVTSTVFSAYRRPLEMGNSFRYLRRIISVEDDDWPAVIRNLEKARAVWRRMTRILIREGEMLRVSTFFFKSVVQSVLLFGD